MSANSANDRVSNKYGNILKNNTFPVHKQVVLSQAAESVGGNELEFLEGLDVERLLGQAKAMPLGNDLRAVGDGVCRSAEAERALLLVLGDEDHALALDAVQLAGLQVADDEHLLLGELLGLEVRAQARDDRPLAALAEADREDVEVLRGRVVGDVLDPAEPQVDRLCRQRHVDLLPLRTREACLELQNLLLRDLPEDRLGLVQLVPLGDAQDELARDLRELGLELGQVEDVGELLREAGDERLGDHRQQADDVQRDDLRRRGSRLVPLLDRVPRGVLLDELVAGARDSHDDLQRLALVDRLHLLEVLLQQAVDLGDALLVVLVELADGRHLLVPVAVDEVHCPVHKVAEVRQELVVVLVPELVPHKRRVCALWSDRQQIVSEDLGGDAGGHRVVAEHANATALRELGVLVIQVFYLKRKK